MILYPKNDRRSRLSFGKSFSECRSTSTPRTKRSLIRSEDVDLSTLFAAGVGDGDLVIVDALDHPVAGDRAGTVSFLA